MRDGGRVSAFCSKVCSNCWSPYNSCCFFILGMQQVIHKLLETV
jgi:hypothetical protein